MPLITQRVIGSEGMWEVYDGDFYKKFNVYDYPDLCDKQRVVGIEVTEAVTIEAAHQVLNEYNDKYDFLYFGYSCGLVYYDIVNSDIQVKIIDRSDYDEFMYAARVKTDI
ncbi:MAG: hypothetical protein J6A75_11850 [Lachnospiraceae bacterium]|nr:hypothetical protein [Lachnospiraceae bacterium]